MGWLVKSDGEQAGGSGLAPFSQLVGFWTPWRFVSAAGIDVAALLHDINEKIQRRGFVLYDGQILTQPLDPTGPIDPVFEPDDLNGEHDVPDRRTWGTEQRDYFGLDNPYQMADEDDTFTWANLTTVVVAPYLRQNELIAGILHGEADNSYFTCTCHYATVVYTTRHRLVCMSCGSTHVVLRHPLGLTPRQLLTPEEWRDLFDQQGTRHHDEVDLATVDFREIKEADKIWTTDQWDDAAHEFVFFARSSPEEIEKAIRGTEMDPSIFLEAGWTPSPEPPAPAFQVRSDSIAVNLEKNAEHAFAEGVTEFVAAYVHPDRLVHAIPHLFRTVELLMKARLETLHPHALDDQPNHPTVVNRLRDAGVSLRSDETETITRMRRLRNDLQHGTASFNHRSGLVLCQRAIIFVDRFVDQELGMWSGDAVSGTDWLAVLDIPEIATRAARIADARLAHYRSDRGASITPCPQCKRETMLRPHPSTGASCAYCGYVPIVHDNA